MGIEITGIGIYRPGIKFIADSIIKMGAKAARRCLRSAKIRSGELEMIVFSGVYRENHIGEPSIASLIQGKIGANNLFSMNSNSLPEIKSTFSFDLNSGGCGFLSAVEIINGFVGNGMINHALVVAGDAVPFRDLSRNYNFIPAAVAVILTNSLENKGFTHLRTYHYPEYENDLISVSRLEYYEQAGSERNILTINKSDSYLNHCHESTLSSVSGFLREVNLNMSDIDLVVCSQGPTGIIEQLKKEDQFGLKLIELPQNHGREWHTAGIGFALNSAMEDGKFHKSKNILFVAIGSGITNVIGLYKNY